MREWLALNQECWITGNGVNRWLEKVRKNKWNIVHVCWTARLSAIMNELRDRKCYCAKKIISSAHPEKIKYKYNCYDLHRKRRDFVWTFIIEKKIFTHLYWQSNKKTATSSLLRRQKEFSARKWAICTVLDPGKTGCITTSKMIHEQPRNTCKKKRSS